jgi:diguanylate cyclase (GGDEF)-like protein
MGSLGTASVTLILTGLLLQLEAGLLLKLAALVLTASMVILLPLQYYLVRTRLERPLLRLEHELLGRLPWRPEGDLLLASLRRAIDSVRLAASEARGQVEEQRRLSEDLYQRLEEKQKGERFVERAAAGLRQAETLSELAEVLTGLIMEEWPAEDVLLLARGESETELELLYWAREGQPVNLRENRENLPRYLTSSLPGPVKHATRRGFYVEAGLPFSCDPAFPEARSFLSVGLEHHGAVTGVLLAATATLQPPNPEGLKRAAPLFSLAFSRSQYLKELREVAIRDGLSGMYTQDHFLSVLRHEVARANRYARPVCCLIVDVDDLHGVNERHGARVGDQVIAGVAGLINGLVRSSDMAARVSGGEFALLLPETDQPAAQIVAERLRARVEELPFIVQANQVQRVTVSVGIGTHPPHGVTYLSLLDASRRALRQAKSEGGNAVSLPPQETT